MKQHTGTIEVVVSGLRSRAGQVLLALWRSEKGFPSQTSQAVATQAIPIRGAQVTGIFEGLEPGSYAAAVVHDANSNGKLDTTWLGIPKEGIGFSNNPRLFFSAPKFASCAVRVYAQGQPSRPLQVVVRIRYFMS